MVAEHTKIKIDIEDTHCNYSVQETYIYMIYLHVNVHACYVECSRSSGHIKYSHVGKHDIQKTYENIKTTIICNYYVLCLKRSGRFRVSFLKLSLQY